MANANQDPWADVEDARGAPAAPAAPAVRASHGSEVDPWAGGVEDIRGGENTPANGAPASGHVQLPAHVTSQSSWSDIGEAARQNAPVEWSNFKTAAKGAMEHPLDTANRMVEGIGALADAALYTPGEYARSHGWGKTADFLESKVNPWGSEGNATGKPFLEPPTDTPEQRAAKAGVVPGMVSDVGDFIAHPATAFGNAPLGTAANVASVVVPELRAGRAGMIPTLARRVLGRVAEAADAGVAAAGAGAAAGFTPAERGVGTGLMQTPDYAKHLAAHGLEPGDLTGEARDAMAGVLGRKRLSPETVKEGIAAGATDEPVIPRHITTGEPIPEPARGLVADSVATGQDAIRDRLGKIAGADVGDAVAPEHAALARGVEDAYVKSKNASSAAYDRAYSSPGTFAPELPKVMDFDMGNAVHGSTPDFPTKVLEGATPAEDIRVPDWDAASRSPSLQQTSAAYKHVMDTLSRVPPGSVDINTMSRLRKDLGSFQMAARGDDAHAMQELIQGFDTGMVRTAQRPGSMIERDAVGELANARQLYRQHMQDFGGKNSIGRATNSMKAELDRDGAGQLTGQSSQATAHGAGYDIGRELMSDRSGPQTYQHLSKIGAKDAADQYIREHVLQHTERGGVSTLKHSPDQIGKMLQQPHIRGAFTPEQLSQLKLANAARRLYDTKPSFTKRLSADMRDHLAAMARRVVLTTAAGAFGGAGHALVSWVGEPMFEKVLAQRAAKRALSGAPKAKGAAFGSGQSLGDRAWTAGRYAVGVPAQFAADQAARFGPKVGRAGMLYSAGQEAQQRASGGPVQDAVGEGWIHTGQGWQHPGDDNSPHLRRADGGLVEKALRVARDAGGALSDGDYNQAFLAALQANAADPDTGPYSGTGGLPYGGKKGYVPKSKAAPHRLLHPAPKPDPAYVDLSTTGNPTMTRAAHKRGGRVCHQHLVDQLFRAVEKAKREEKSRTSVILNQPDEKVAKALNIAQAAI